MSSLHIGRWCAVGIGAFALLVAGCAALAALVVWAWNTYHSSPQNIHGAGAEITVELPDLFQGIPLRDKQLVVEISGRDMCQVSGSRKKLVFVLPEGSRERDVRILVKKDGDVLKAVSLDEFMNENR